jgi:hypothetical protein
MRKNSSSHFAMSYIKFCFLCILEARVSVRTVNCPNGSFADHRFVQASLSAISADMARTLSVSDLKLVYQSEARPPYSR